MTPRPGRQTRPARLGRTCVAFAAGLALTGLAGCAGSGTGVDPSVPPVPAPPSASTPIGTGAQVAIYDMTEGTCLPLSELRGRDGDANIIYDTVPCEQKHAAEFYHVDADFYIDHLEPPAQTPENVQAAQGECWAALAEYTGANASEAAVTTLIWAPGPNSWAAGERSLLCLADRKDEAGALMEWSGTLKAS